jgi:beta-glucosidase
LDNLKYKSAKYSLVCIALMLFATALNAQNQPKNEPAKIWALIRKMTLEEKINMLHANGLFSSAGVKRLGVPGLISDDGPLGVREELKEGWGSANLKTDSATFFPNGSALAATWNTELVRNYGIALGQEARARHKDIILAPAFNIARTPLGGRTYEYYSEDPFLNAQLAVAAVQGIQSNHVAACIKHFALNNQETDRMKVNVEVSDRALQEIYLPAFKAAVQQGKAWAVMAAYNKFRGEYCSENSYLLHHILKQQWGFPGVVMSDWGGTHSTIQAAKNGLDLEMGTERPYNQFYFAQLLLDAIKAGIISRKVIDEKVYRLLWLMHRTSLYKTTDAGKINSIEHSRTAYNIAKESIVLLKNSHNLLPLNITTIKSLAVIGDNATHTFQNEGFGAGVKAKYEVTPLQGLKNRIGNVVDVRYAQGYTANYKTGNSSEQNTRANQPSASLIKEAVSLAKGSSAAIVFVGGNRIYESEGTDRKNLQLPFGVQELIDAVSAVNNNTIVVVVGGAPYDLSEIQKNNHTIIWSWYNGCEGGNALADVITGKVNPSGKLPFTFPVNLNDSPVHALQTFPGNDLTTTYKEGILVGYRWYDTKNIVPLYPFGYGLSYTSYSYSAVQTDKKNYKPGEKITITLKVTNKGMYDGKEIVQLYATKDKSAVSRAAKELKAFKKIWVPAGKSVQIKLTVNVNDLAYYNDKTMQWTVEPGSYRLMLASSAVDIKQTTNVIIGR